MTMNGNTKDVNYQPLASEIITDLQKEKMARNFVRAAYNQQPKESEEEE